MAGHRHDFAALRRLPGRKYILTNAPRHYAMRVLEALGITGLFDTNGRWDLLAEIRSPNLNELAAVLERVRLIKGIASTETSIHLQSYKLS